MKPDNYFQAEAQELQEILAKRHKRGRVIDDKPIDEKTVLHSKALEVFDYIWIEKIFFT